MKFTNWTLSWFWIMCLSCVYPFFNHIFDILITIESHILFFIIQFPKLLTARKMENKENHLPNHHFQVRAVNLPGCKLFQTLCHFINDCFFWFLYILPIGWFFCHLPTNWGNQKQPLISDISSDKNPPVFFFDIGASAVGSAVARACDC